MPCRTDDELARDATVNGQQFSVRNFVVSTYTGVIGRVIAAERDVRVGGLSSSRHNLLPDSVCIFFQIFMLDEERDSHGSMCE